MREVDAIIDVVASGRTLIENGLSIAIDNLGRLAIGATWQKVENEIYDITKEMGT